MKLPLMAALAALTFWGCSSQSENTRPDDTAQTETTTGTGGAGQSGADMSREQRQDAADAEESPLESGNVVENEREDREGAPTVYDGEATGGSGTDTSVTTDEGEKWDVMEEPGDDEPRNKDGVKDSATGGSGDGDTTMGDEDSGETR